MDEQMTPKEKLAASTEILAAVSAATVAASVQMEPEELNAPKREFGSVAYERVLTERECHCVERTAKKLKVLGKLIHVWVKDARSYRHGVESEVPYFSLRVAASIPVTELRELVQEQFTLLSSYRKQVDGELQLCFDDQMLDDEELFSTYLSGGSATNPTQKSARNNSANCRPSWPKPFAGILWVLPWRPSRKQPLQWGCGENSTTNEK